MVDILVNVKKACSPEETAPKRKHVRACVVYTWDHKDLRAFWQLLKATPLQNDEVQVFKALILIHKVLQEGHRVVLRDAQRNRDFILSLASLFRSDGFKGYGKLIREYDDFLMRKLAFHRNHKEFNGTFEYEEYISLRAVLDPNEGYESILDLMDLQDAIDQLQHVVLALISHDRGSECKILVLVPLVTELYGIYKFATLMLRAMHQQTYLDEALEPLRQRYVEQHARLYEFYQDCSSIRYLTLLINVPKLPMESPDLFVDEVTGERIALRPLPPERATPPERSTPPEPVRVPLPPPKDEERAQLEAQYEAERQAALARQQQEQQQFQAMLQQQQLQQQQLQQQQQQQLYAQHTAHVQGRVSELERDVVMLRAQNDQDQLLLQQYDARVRQLEQDVVSTNQAALAQLALKEEALQQTSKDVETWRNKYELLAKLYLQLRLEHLSLLERYKKLQQRAALLQEAIERRERMEREMKAKNLELAGLIRERDRARLELEKARGGLAHVIEKLEAELKEAREQLKLSEALAVSLARSSEKDTQIENLLRALEQMRVERDASEAAVDEQIDAVLGDQVARLASILDAVLRAGLGRIRDAVFGGGGVVRAPYVLSLIEKAGGLSAEFATAFSGLIAEGPSGDHASVVGAASAFSAAVCDVILNLGSDQGGLADAACELLESLVLTNTAGMTDQEKTDLAIDGVVKVHEALERVENALPKTEAHTEAGLDLEMAQAAKTIQDAAAHLEALEGRLVLMAPEKLEVNKALLGCATAITRAVALLIARATDTQNEIVAAGGGATKTEFYAKNLRWTEGMILAAQAVAGSTKLLIQTADACLDGAGSEELVVALGDVAASTVQLVAAARVKAVEGLKALGLLEEASKGVSQACNSLVKTVEGMVGGDAEEGVGGMSLYETKKAELQQQAEIVRLENALSRARVKLGEIRKVGYRGVEAEED